MIRRLVELGFAFGLLAHFALGQTPGSATGTIQGIVLLSRSSSWAKLAPHLNHDFLWLPWSWVTIKQFLANLPLAQIHSVSWAEPAYSTLHEVTRDNASSALLHPEGVAVTSP